MLQEMAASTGEIPPALASRPTLPAELAYYYRQFELISKDRLWSDGAPFPLSSRNLLDFFTLYGIPRDEWEAYTDYFSRIDPLWLDMQMARREQKLAQAKASSAPSR